MSKITGPILFANDTDDQSYKFIKPLLSDFFGVEVLCYGLQDVIKYFKEETLEEFKGDFGEIEQVVVFISECESIAEFREIQEWMDRAYADVPLIWIFGEVSTNLHWPFSELVFRKRNRYALHFSENGGMHGVDDIKRLLEMNGDYAQEVEDFLVADTDGRPTELFEEVLEENENDYLIEILNRVFIRRPALDPRPEVGSQTRVRGLTNRH